MKKMLFLSFVYLLSSCRENQENKKNNSEKMEHKNLLENVKLSISPKFQDWVLFKNGTYLIFDNADTIPDIGEQAIKEMKEFGPVYVGSSAGDFNVIGLKQTEGWIVSGHGYGMYTYVNPSELENKNPSDIEIGLYGRSKRDKDGRSPEIIYINKKESH